MQSRFIHPLYQVIPTTSLAYGQEDGVSPELQVIWGFLPIKAPGLSSHPYSYTGENVAAICGRLKYLKGWALKLCINIWQLGWIFAFLLS